MKIRQGFVSNSSSSSFIINWKFSDPSFAEGEPNRLNFALCVLLDAHWQYDNETGDFNFGENKYDEELEKNIQEIIENTKETSPGCFRSNFFTCMRNDASDYGDACMLLNTALLEEKATEQRFEIINIEIDSDC